MDDRFNTIAGWTLAAGIVALGLSSLSSHYFRADKEQRPEKMGYEIAGVVSSAGGAVETPIEALLAKVGLPKSMDKFPNQMSGGMQQRLQIARCLAQDPTVLLMDEPFGALDAMTRQGLQDEILQIVDQTGATAFFVTHDLEEALYLGDRVVGLLPHPGRVGLAFDVKLPRPRDQLSTREDPEFLRLRRELFDFIKAAES